MMFSGTEHEAKIQYESGDYKIIRHGAYVTCAVSGEKILLDELKYWNHLRQEPYASCELSYQRELKINPHLRKLLGSTIK